MNRDEFRKHERYKVKDGALVVLEPDFDRIGKIVDISQGGLSFLHKGKKEMMSNPCEVSFVFDNAAGRMRHGPFKFSTNIISDAKINNKNLNNSDGMKCCRMKFQDLSYYQKLWVDECIRNHTKSPAKSTMT